VDRLLDADPHARVVVLAISTTILERGGPAGVGSAARQPPPARAEKRRYTFNFEGTAQALDHVVVSPALARGARPRSCTSTPTVRTACA